MAFGMIIDGGFSINCTFLIVLAPANQFVATMKREVCHFGVGDDDDDDLSRPLKSLTQK